MVQLDIEASFCSSKFVISHVETLVKYLYRAFDKRFQIDLDNHDCHHPAFDPQHEVQDRDMGGRSRSKEDFNVGRSMLTFADFPAMAYTEAMRAHGNDKPDLRIRLPYTSTVSVYSPSYKSFIFKSFSRLSTAFCCLCLFPALLPEMLI